MFATMTFEEIDNYTEGNINPPIDINGDPMNEFSAFTQNVDIVHVLESNLQTIDSSDSSDFIRITITINKNGSPINSASWIRANL